MDAGTTVEGSVSMKNTSHKCRRFVAIAATLALVVVSCDATISFMGSYAVVGSIPNYPNPTPAQRQREWELFESFRQQGIHYNEGPSSAAIPIYVSRWHYWKARGILKAWLADEPQKEMIPDPRYRDTTRDLDIAEPSCG